MTPHQLAEVITYCEDRWPGTRNYQNWDKAAWDFINIAAEAAHEAAQHHFAAGERTAPTLSQLRAESARIGAERGLTDPEATNCETRGRHSRTWAITDQGNGKREAQCLDCGTIIIRPADQLPTVGEATERQQGMRRPAPDAAITERIAP